MNALKKMRDYSSGFELNSMDGPSSGPIIKEFNSGSRVIIVSVHAINHYSSNGSSKYADMYTGPIALYLQEELGCNIIINLRKDISISPHNGTTPAEKSLAKFDRKCVVFDIHGAKDCDKFDIYLGTHLEKPNSEQIKVLNIFSEMAALFDVRVSINDPRYSAKSKKTITAIGIELGFKNSIQIEITKSGRDFINNPQKVERILDFLKNAIGRCSEV